MSSLPRKRPRGNLFAAPAPRSERIGSGDIAAILGLPDAFGSPYSVWAAKTTGEEPELDEKTKARFWWGNKLEALILDRYHELTPTDTRIPSGNQRHYKHWQYPFLTATVDGLFETPGGIQYITEAKFSSFDIDDGVPLRVQAQCQWQMGISRIYHCVAAILFSSKVDRDVQIREIKFEPETFQQILSVALRFWRDNVLTKVAPPIDGHRGTTAALKRIKGVADQVVDISHLMDQVNQLNQIKLSQKSLERSRTELENRFRFDMGSATLGQINGEDALTWRHNKNGTRNFRFKPAFSPKGLDDE